MSSLDDVAKMAKVSLMTVSRVVHGDAKVKQETRERVLEAIRILDYQPNAIARALSSNKTMNIGLILPKIEHVLAEPYFGSIIYYLETALSQYQYNLLIDSSEHGEKKEMSTLYDTRKVDGLIIIGSRIDDTRISALSEKNVPSVLVHARSELSGINYVDIDNHQVIDCLFSYLYKHGHSRIGLITGDLSVLNAHDRLVAYKNRMITSAIGYDEELVYEGDWTSKAGYDALQYFIGLDAPPTAVISSNDHMAIGFIKGASDFNVSIPDAISVVGIDDIEIASFSTPRLTTIRQPIHTIAQMAVEALMRSIKAKALRSSQIILHAELIERESCKTLVRD